MCAITSIPCTVPLVQLELDSKDSNGVVHRNGNVCRDGGALEHWSIFGAFSRVWSESAGAFLERLERWSTLECWSVRGAFLERLSIWSAIKGQVDDAERTTRSPTR